MAPSVVSPAAKPETTHGESPGDEREDDATSTTYRDRDIDSPTAAMSPRSYTSTGSSMAAGDERPGTATSETPAADDPSCSSPELGGQASDVTSGHHVTSGLTSGRQLPGLIQTLHEAHRGMLDVMQARGGSGASAVSIPPGIIASSPGHPPPPFPAFAYNGIHHAAAAAAIAALPGRAHPAPSGTGNRAISPATLQAALAGSGGGVGSAFHAPSSSTVRLAGRPPVTAVVTSAGSSSTSATDNALQRLAAQAAQQHIHSLQLDWLARAGVYMPRLIDYNGRR